MNAAKLPGRLNPIFGGSLASSQITMICTLEQQVINIDLFFCFCAAVSVSILPLRRGSDPIELLNEDECEGFWRFFGLIPETICEFFKNTYDLHVASIESEKINCKVFSIDAIEKFQNDVQNGSAGSNFEKALHFRETDPVIKVELSSRDYFKTKTFLSSLQNTESQQT